MSVGEAGGRKEEESERKIFFNDGLSYLVTVLHSKPESSRGVWYVAKVDYVGTMSDGTMSD